MERVGAALEEAAERLDLRAAIRRHPGAEQGDGEPVEASPEALGEAARRSSRGSGDSVTVCTTGPTVNRWSPRE